MDLKRFGAFVVLIGLLIAAYGVIQIAMNQPVHTKQSDETGLDAAINNMGNALNALSENVSRKEDRKSAVKVILVGGGVAIVGIGLRSSAKKNGQAPAQ